VGGFLRATALPLPIFRPLAAFAIVVMSAVAVVACSVFYARRSSGNLDFLAVALFCCWFHANVYAFAGPLRATLVVPPSRALKRFI
jgi:hypothetical protein